jgi:TRAP-type C4-dicarboxylate transport system permease small subunit
VSSVTRVIDITTTGLGWIAGIAVVFLMLHITADVVGRALFGTTLDGTIIIVSNYYMLAVVCLPLAWVERSNAHINVDVLTNLFPQRVQRPLFGWTYLLVAAVFGLVAYGSWIEAVVQFMAGKFALEQNIVFPTWPGYFAVPIGYGVGTLYALLKFAGFLVGVPPKPIPDDLRHQVERLSND